MDNILLYSVDEKNSLKSLPFSDICDIILNYDKILQMIKEGENLNKDEFYKNLGNAKVTIWISFFVVITFFCVDLLTSGYNIGNFNDICSGLRLFVGYSIPTVISITISLLWQSYLTNNGIINPKLIVKAASYTAFLFILSLICFLLYHIVTVSLLIVATGVYIALFYFHFKNQFIEESEHTDCGRPICR